MIASVGGPQQNPPRIDSPELTRVVIWLLRRRTIQLQRRKVLVRVPSRLTTKSIIVTNPNITAMVTMDTIRLRRTARLPIPQAQARGQIQPPMAISRISDSNFAQPTQSDSDISGYDGRTVGNRHKRVANVYLCSRCRRHPTTPHHHGRQLHATKRLHSTAGTAT